MSSNVRILTESHFEGGAFGTLRRDGCDVTGLANLLDGRCARVLLIEPTQATRITYRFGGNLQSPRLADTFALGNLAGIPSGSTIELKFFESTGFAGDGITRTITYEANTIDWGASDNDTWEAELPANVYIYLDEPYEYQSIQCTLNMTFGAGYDDLFATVGRVLVGHAFCPRIGYAPGANIIDIDPSRHRRTSGGGIHTIGKRPYRRFNLSLNHLNPNDREILSAQLKRVGKTADILVALDEELTGEDALDHAMIGRLANNKAFSRANVPWYSANLVIEETCAAPVAATASLSVKSPFLDVQTGEIDARGETFSISGETATIETPGNLPAKFMVANTETAIGEFTLTRVTDGIEFTLKMGSTSDDDDNLTVAASNTSTLVRIDYESHAVNVPGPSSVPDGDLDDPYTWTVESTQFKDLIDDILETGADTDIILTWFPGPAPVKSIEISEFSYSGESLTVELTKGIPRKLYCIDDSGEELWVIDITDPGNSLKIDDLPSGLSVIETLAEHNGKLYCIDNSGRELWEINISTPLDSVELTGTLPTGLTSTRGLTSHEDVLYAITNSGAIWEVDTDTLSNSSHVGSVDVSGNNQVGGLASHKGALYYSLWDVQGNDSMRRIDNISAGTTTSLGVFPLGLQRPEGLASHLDSLYAVNDSGDELWLLDISDIENGSSEIGTFPSGLSTPLSLSSFGTS